ncbi:MAG: DUF488 family protein [Solirubrobacterales bacterium]
MATSVEILTVGHSNHGDGEFIALLQSAGVELLVDVRANPRSRHPQFNRSALAGALKEAGIDYVHLGAELGGRREPQRQSPNDAWEEGPSRGYADHMATDEFAAGIARLRELGAERRAILMCAEADWTRCHRRLIADALVAAGDRVLHLGPDGSLTEHELNESAVESDGRLVYPEPQTSLDV